jgi:hypothetical protein
MAQPWAMEVQRRDFPVCLWVVSGEEEEGAGDHFDDAVDSGCEEACVCALRSISRRLYLLVDSWTYRNA